MDAIEPKPELCPATPCTKPRGKAKFIPRPIRSGFRFLLARFGYEIRLKRKPRKKKPRPRVGARIDIPSGTKLNVGCGRKSKEGYIGCDVRPLDKVDVVCPAWEVPKYCHNLGEIYSRHMLEHLTLCEVDYTLHQWFHALAVGGRVHVIVPYLPYHIKQLQRAVWSEQELADRGSNTRVGIAGLYGWQYGCDPSQGKYKANYWDAHKIGFDQRLMTFLLTKAGFEEIELIVKDKCHLVARAVRRRETAAEYPPLFPRKVRQESVAKTQLSMKNHS